LGGFFVETEMFGGNGKGGWDDIFQPVRKHGLGPSKG
jgi:hypothetical protein